MYDVYDIMYYIHTYCTECYIQVIVSLHNTYICSSSFILYIYIYVYVYVYVHIYLCRCLSISFYIYLQLLQRGSDVSDKIGIEMIEINLETLVSQKPDRGRDRSNKP